MPTVYQLDPVNVPEGRALFSNQDGPPVIEATLTGRLPGEAERAVLEAMVAEGDPTNKLAAGGTGP